MKHARRPIQPFKRCYYHLCRKATRLYPCKFCGNWFCSQHVEARKPSAPQFKGQTKEEILEHEEWAREGGHPCPAVVPFYESRQEAEREQERVAFNAAFRRPRGVSGRSESQGFTYLGENNELIRRGVPRFHSLRPKWFTLRRVARLLKNLFVGLFLLGVAAWVVLYIAEHPSPEATFAPPNLAGASRPAVSVSELELEVHAGINAQRTQNGLSVLSWDDRLASIARGHSQDMANRNYFAHSDPEGRDTQSRYASAGFVCNILYRVDPDGTQWFAGGAENIFQNNLYSGTTYTNGIVTSRNWNSQGEIAASTVQGWMNSPGHRANILTPYFRSEGIGVAIAADDKVYITENFC